MRVWLDDVRPAPEGWVLSTSEEHCVGLLETGEVTEISLDHDLGFGKEHQNVSGIWIPSETAGQAGSGYNVALWIERAAFDGVLPRIRWSVHSQNPVGAARIKAAMESAERYWGCGHEPELAFGYQEYLERLEGEQE